MASAPAPTLAIAAPAAEPADEALKPATQEIAGPAPTRGARQSADTALQSSSAQPAEALPAERALSKARSAPSLRPDARPASEPPLTTLPQCEARLQRLIDERLRAQAEQLRQDCLTRWPAWQPPPALLEALRALPEPR